MSGEPLIDVHSHFVTPEYVDAATKAGIAHPDGMPRWPEWDEHRHLSDMDDAGIAHAVLSISSPGTHFGDDEAARAVTRQVNDAGAAIRARHPDRFGQFASLPLPDVDGALAEVSRALDDLGADGVTFETNAHGIYPGDERYEPLWGELDRRAAIAFVHPTSTQHPELALGRPAPMLEFIFDTTRAVSDLLFAGVFERFPAIRWVFTHGGGTLPLTAERIELFRSGFGVGEAMSPAPEQLARLWFDTAGTPFPFQIPTLVSAFGARHVVYGSDYCWTPSAAVAQQVASIDHTTQPEDDTWRALTTRNARVLLPRLA